MFDNFLGSLTYGMKQPIRKISWEALQSLKDLTSEVLPNEPEWPTAPSVGVTQFSSRMGMDALDHPFGWNGGSSGQRRYAIFAASYFFLFFFCVRLSDHKHLSYKRTVNCDHCDHCDHCDPEVWRDAKPPGVN